MTKEEFYNQGMELFAQDQLDEAIVAYRQALDLDPNYADALHALAMTYAHQEKLDEAIEVGKKLIRSGSQRRIGLHQSFDILSAKGDDRGSRGNRCEGPHPGLETPTQRSIQVRQTLIKSLKACAVAGNTCRTTSAFARVSTASMKRWRNWMRKRFWCRTDCRLRTWARLSACASILRSQGKI